MLSSLTALGGIGSNSPSGITEWVSSVWMHARGPGFDTRLVHDFMFSSHDLFKSMHGFSNSKVDCPLSLLKGIKG